MAVRAVRGASHVSISEDTGSALKCIIGHCIQGRLWRFPFLLSGSRRWDHRTSLHRWQPRLKVSRSRGAYRLLARCEILPCMLFSACARSFITQRDGMSLLSHQRQGRVGMGGGEAAIWCFIVLSLLFWLISSTNVKPPVHDLFAVWGIRNKLISLWIPVNINHGVMAF